METDTTKTISQVMEEMAPAEQKESQTTTASSASNPETFNKYEQEQHIEMLRKAIAEIRSYDAHVPDFTNSEIYSLHSSLVLSCANFILSKQQKKFVVDDTNRDIIRFLMLYFNRSPLALEVFPDRGYSLNKNILLVGSVGVGKTLLMDVFALYLSKISSRLAYKVVSQTQMLNHFKQHNNIDLFTFNTSERGTFDGNPFSLCLNDIGLKTQRFYGNDTETIIEEFLYARYEIWEQQGKFTHLTTNLDKQEIEELFYDKHGRLADRFKMFNVIPLKGNSRR